MQGLGSKSNKQSKLDRPELNLRKLNRRNVLKLGTAASVAGLVNFGPGSIRDGSADSRAKLPIGMNLAGIADWQAGFPFLNVMWGARVWYTANVSRQGDWNTDKGAAIELDDNGYPLEVPFAAPGTPEPQYVFTVLPNTLKPGKYVILYDGDGIINTLGETKAVDWAPGRIEIGMRHHGDDRIEGISILKSTRGNHIRNIRILPIAQEHANLDETPFLPEAVDFCAPWHCLRFMDWLGTNNNIDVKWDNRNKTSFYTQVGVAGNVLADEFPAWQSKWGGGTSLELCLKLANTAKKHAWLCVPHLADDDYIFKMATLVKEQLDPGLKVYVEYSNEIWNWQFGQAQWMLRSELGGDLVEAGGGSPPWKNRTKPKAFKKGVAEGDDDGVDHPERIGALFRRCFKIWETVFDGADRARLVRVCAVQGVWFDASQRTLDWVMSHGGCDALAPTGYFGPNDEVYARWDKAGASLTAEQVLADMKPRIAHEATVARTNAQMAKAAGVKLLVYEGGQHIQPQGQAEKPYNPALGAAQTHPGMYDIYRDNLDIYAGLGCDLFCAFSSVSGQGGRWGSWGHIERYGQDPATAPKYRAILDANIAPT